MALFEYNALTDSGRLMTGTIEASTSQQAHEMLKSMNLQVNDLSKIHHKTSHSTVGRNEFLLFNQQLASLTKAGIPLERGLRELAADADSARMKSLINEIACRLEAGVPIEKAIEEKQKQFPPLYGQILKAGIETGRLSEMLTGLNRHLEIAQRTRRIIIESITYPAIVFLFAAIIITMTFIYLIPGFAEVLSDMSDGEAGLPTLTVFYLNAAHYVWHFWIAAGIIIATLIFIWLSLSSTAASRKTKERIICATPLLGRVFHNGVLARFSEAMAVMVSTGCPLQDVFRLAGRSCSSQWLAAETEIIAQQIEQGKNILEASLTSQMIPRLFLYSMQLGTQRNELIDNLHSLGSMYAQKTYSMQGRLQAILMPILLIGLGLIIGTMVISMVLPMVKITTILM